MNLSTDNIILLLKYIGENLILGRGIESSLYYSLKNLPDEIDIKKLLLNMINLGYCYDEILIKLYDNTEDKSVARIWDLLQKTTKLSSNEAGIKLLKIVNHLETNRKMAKNRLSKIKAQKYKVYFLGFITASLLGFVSGLAPLFATFMQIFRAIAISTNTLFLIPISLYIISQFSIFFLSDIALIKYNRKLFVLSSIIYAVSFFIGKGILFMIF